MADEALDDGEEKYTPPKPPFKPAWLVEADKLAPTVIVEHPSFGGRKESRRRKKANGSLGSTPPRLCSRRLAPHWWPLLRAQKEREAAAAKIHGVRATARQVDE